MNRKELFILSLTIFLTVVTWVISDILHSQAQVHAKIDTSVPSTKKYHIDENIFTILKTRAE